MSSRDTFSAYSPVINFIFYIGAIACGMFFIHPAFLACAVVLSAAYYLTIKGGKGIKVVLGMIPVWIALSVINPLVNTRGDIVLFTYFGDRPYTFEALCYGMAVGAMFVSVIMWFLSYNAVMTSDKFIYLFGRAIPSASLILTMVLRLDCRGPQVHRQGWRFGEQDAKGRRWAYHRFSAYQLGFRGRHHNG